MKTFCLMAAIGKIELDNFREPSTLGKRGTAKQGRLPKVRPLTREFSGRESVDAKPGCGESYGGVRCGSRAEVAAMIHVTAGVHLVQARAEVGAGRRSQLHAGPQIAAQQQVPLQRHALLQQTVAAGWQRRPLGRSQLGGGSAQAAGLPSQGYFLGGNRQMRPDLSSRPVCG